MLDVLTITTSNCRITLKPLHLQPLLTKLYCEEVIEVVGMTIPNRRPIMIDIVANGIRAVIIEVVNIHPEFLSLTIGEFLTHQPQLIVVVLREAQPNQLPLFSVYLFEAGR